MTSSNFVLPPGVTFYGTDTHETGKFYYTELDRVNDLPSVRTDDVPRPGGHGSFETPTWYEPRLIQARGVVRATSETELFELRQAFAGILSGTGTGTVTFTEFGVVRTATVERYGQWRFTVLGSSLIATWLLRLRAPNPRLHIDGFGSTF